MSTVMAEVIVTTMANEEVMVVMILVMLIVYKRTRNEVPASNTVALEMKFRISISLWTMTVTMFLPMYVQYLVSVSPFFTKSFDVLDLF